MRSKLTEWPQGVGAGVRRGLRLKVGVGQSQPARSLIMKAKRQGGGYTCYGAARSWPLSQAAPRIHTSRPQL